VIPRRSVAVLAVLSGAAFLLLGVLVAARWGPLLGGDQAVEYRCIAGHSATPPPSTPPR
jgi:hypothetical protein